MSSGYRAPRPTFGPLVVSQNTDSPSRLDVAADRLVIALGASMTALLGGLCCLAIWLLMWLLRGYSGFFPNIGMMVSGAVFLLLLGVLVPRRLSAAARLRKAQQLPPSMLRSEAGFLILERGGQKERYPIASAQQCVYVGTGGAIAPGLEVVREDGHRLRLGCTELSNAALETPNMIDRIDFDLPASAFRDMSTFLLPESRIALPEGTADEEPAADEENSPERRRL